MAEIREGIAKAGLRAKQFDEDADDARLNRGATDGARIPWPIEGLCSVENTNAILYWNCPGIVSKLSSRGDLRILCALATGEEGCTPFAGGRTVPNCRPNSRGGYVGDRYW